MATKTITTRRRPTMLGRWLKERGACKRRAKHFHTRTLESAYRYADVEDLAWAAGNLGARCNHDAAFCVYKLDKRQLKKQYPLAWFKAQIRKDLAK